jgi:predicted ATPase
MKAGGGHRGRRFVGRRAELGRLRSLLADHRLVTIWAPAGMGKTRLAWEYLGEAARRGERTLFVDLSDVEDLDGVVARLRSSLEDGAAGIDRGAGSKPTAAPSVGSLGRAMAAQGPMLVVLDNFEQLAPQAAESIGVWLRLTSATRFLVTSRERLRLSGEQAVELSPLRVPETDDVEGAEAVELFLARVREVRPGATPASAAKLAELARKLEGIPLVIELAAGRFDVLGVDGLLERLPRRLDLLARGPRDVGGRQATLRGAIAWSWALLAPAERSALARCATFRGGFTLEAAEGVLEVPAALEALHSLRDRSLLTATFASGVARFALYEAIRAFAEEKLVELGDAEMAERRHAAYFLELARQRPTVAAIAVERENLRAVAERAISTGAGVDALEALVALDPVATACGTCESRIDALDAALGLVSRKRDGASRKLYARGLECRGRARQTAGRFADATSDFERALAIARRLRDRALEGVMLTNLGVVRHLVRDMKSARACYLAALPLLRRAHDVHSEGRVLGNLGALAHDAGKLSVARGYYDRALRAFVKCGDVRHEGIFLTNLALLLNEAGDVQGAGDFYARACRVLRAASDPRLEGITLGNLGAFHHEHGRLDEALTCQQRALRLLREVGDPRTEALCLARLGALRAALGDPEAAQTDFEAADALVVRLDDKLTEAAVEAYRAFAHVGKAAMARAGGRVEEWTMHERAARNEVARVSGDLSDDVRAAARMVETALGRIACDKGGEGTPPLSPLESVRDDALVVGPEAMWFRPPRGQWHDLSDRIAARRILWQLAELHRRGPGESLSLEALGEVGWPGERVMASSRANRVNVALAYLRKQGLRPYLKRGAAGYSLAETLLVHRILADYRALSRPSDD